MSYDSEKAADTNKVIAVLEHADASNDDDNEVFRSNVAGENYRAVSWSVLQQAQSKPAGTAALH